MKRKIKITESQMRKIIDRISEGEYHMDEATEETIKKTTYKPEEVRGGIDVKDGTVTPTEDGGMVVTSESDDLLDEDIFEEDKEITSWDDVPMA